MQIVFFGTSEFAVQILKAVVEKTGWDIALVVTEPAKLAGRRQEITKSPVCAYAKLAGLKIITPPSLESAEVASEIESVQPDVMIVAAYGKIIPPEIFSLPPHGIVNIHPSLLPKLRGPSPIQTALLQGLKETGMSLMIIDEQVDHGHVLSQDGFPIASDDTYLILEKKLSQLGADILIRDLPRYINGQLKPKEQDHSQATFTKMIKKEDGLVDWSKSADEIFNQWRAFIKWPGAYTFFEKTAFSRSDLQREVGPRPQSVRLKLTDIKKVNLDHNHPHGIVFLDEDKNLLVACNPGAIQLVKIQPESGKILTALEFLNGYRDIVGQVLH